MTEVMKTVGSPAVNIADALNFVATASEGVLVFDTQDRLTFINERARNYFRGYAISAGDSLDAVAERIMGAISARALILFKKASRKYVDDGFSFKLDVKDERIQLRARHLASGGVAISLGSNKADDRFATNRMRQAQQFKLFLKTLNAHRSNGVVWLDTIGQLRTPDGQRLDNNPTPPIDPSMPGPTPIQDLLNAVATHAQSHQFSWRSSDGTWHALNVYSNEAGGFLCAHSLMSGVQIGPSQPVTDAVDQKELSSQGVLRGAVDQLDLGVSIVGPDRCIKYFNPRYLQIYDSLPGSISVGDHLGHVAKLRNLSAIEIVDADIDFEGLLAEVAISETDIIKTLKIPSGRFIKVQFQRLAGGGYVTTHQDITEQYLNQERIRHMARHDALTNLPNRFSFSEHLDQALARAKRGETMALLGMDLDRFKIVNDNLGHEVGDKVLVEVAKRISTAIRDTEFAARVGGDEFTAIIGPLERPEHAATVAQRLINSIDEPMLIDGQTIQIGLSVGIAIAPDDGLTESDLMRNADLALYRSKMSGRGNYHFFKSGMDREIRERREQEVALQKAFEHDEFELVFQPLLCAQTARITGFESLIRWNHPTLGPLEPSKFFDVVEDTGLIVPLGRWILKRACQAATEWPDHIRVAVNLSSVQCVEAELVRCVEEALNISGLRPDRLELEITETLLLRDPKRVMTVLHELRRLGVRISLDDFGTGYSTLNYMREFPFDRVKIDGSIVSEINANDEENTVVAAMLGLGGSLGVVLNAEGVENEDQLDFVTKHGCREVQGYLFSPPLPLNLATDLLGASENKAAKSLGISKARG